MFINKQASKNVEYYQRILKSAGSLSNLFSDSKNPYLGYRLVENLFCKSFGSNNLSRSDCSVDASKKHVGIGIKTFLYKNGKSFEKIAEFNKELNLFKGLTPEKTIQYVANLRNERMDFTKRNYKLKDMIYHCVVRSEGRIQVYEALMSTIDLKKIKNISSKRNSLSFSDESNEYTFNLSKSTLFKQFVAEKFLLDFKVDIIADPFEALDKLLSSGIKELVFEQVKEQKHIFLPLYSGRMGKKDVPEKSGLNQWNASGRARNHDEIYIPIPIWIHQTYKDFFPPRDVSFNLHLPNGEKLSAKVCQDSSKALMSNPNSSLGKWLLRDVLNLKERQLLTYKKLEVIGLDSVVVYKLDQNNFEINFSKIGSYEHFTKDAEAPIEDSDEI